MNTEIEKLKKRIEDWSGFPVALDENSSQEEWFSEIDTLIDQLTNEVTDMGNKFRNQIKNIVSEE